MIAFLRHLFSRKPKPGVTGVYLYARTSGTEPWRSLGQHKSIQDAQEASEMYAAHACFKSGHVVFFEFKFNAMLEPTS